MFQQVSRKGARLRMLIDGVSGSGKTWTALTFAHALKDAGLGSKIGVIDTEQGSAKLYHGENGWDWLGADLVSYAPTTYTSVIQGAAREGVDILIIDSLSHAWMGKDGALQQVDKAKGQKGGTFYGEDGWRKVTPQHDEMVSAILSFPGHIFATLRTKSEYLPQPDGSVKKVGMKMVQRAGMEYEFTVVLDMDLDHCATVSKTRCKAIDGRVVPKPGADFMGPVIEWLQGQELDTGDNVVAEAPPPVDTVHEKAAAEAAARQAGYRAQDSAGATPDEMEAEARVAGPIKAPELVPAGEFKGKQIAKLWDKLEHPAQELVKFMESKGVQNLEELEEGVADRLIARLTAEDHKRQADAAF